MNGSVIQNNKASPGGNSSGGGVYVANGSFTMTNNAQILNNEASNGGGVFLYLGSSFSMENSTISGNHATKGNGGGVCISNKDMEISISGSTISNNTAEHPESWGGYGGGISGNGNLTITDSKITGNKANSGGGIHSNNSVTMENTEVSKNTAANVGGGIFNPGHLDVNGGSITGNRAENGSGIYNQHGEWSPGELTISSAANISNNCVADA